MTKTERIFLGKYDKQQTPVYSGALLVKDGDEEGVYYVAEKNGKHARKFVKGKKGGSYCLLNDIIKAGALVAQPEQLAALGRSRKNCPMATSMPESVSEAAEALDEAVSDAVKEDPDPQGSVRLANLRLNYSDQELADELRRRGFEVTARKVVTVEL